MLPQDAASEMEGCCGAVLWQDAGMLQRDAGMLWRDAGMLWQDAGMLQQAKGCCLCWLEPFAHRKASGMHLPRELQLVLHHLHLGAAGGFGALKVLKAPWFLQAASALCSSLPQ